MDPAEAREYGLIDQIMDRRANPPIPEGQNPAA
jgi:ATP-dependent protease ClpP protease subunit